MSGMNERRLKLKRVGLWACGVVLVLSLVLWAVSIVKGYTLMFRTVFDVRDVQIGHLKHYEVDVRTRQIAAMNGRLVVSTDVFTRNSPLREDLGKQWSSEKGWSLRPLANWQVMGQSWFDGRERRREFLGIAGAVKLGREDKILGIAAIIPFWLVAGVVVVPLTVAFVRHVRRSRRRSEGLCAFCGYSRAGLARAIACPECGKVDHLSQQG